MTKIVLRDFRFGNYVSHSHVEFDKDVLFIYSHHGTPDNLVQSSVLLEKADAAKLLDALIILANEIKAEDIKDE